jgi:hypothetical protein
MFFINEEGEMYKLILIMTLLFLTACMQERGAEQVIIPEEQLEALQKAKNIEAQLIKIDQKKDEKLKNQGL